MRMLVTGGAGFIGSHVVDRLVERGDEVVIIDDLSSGSAANVPARSHLIRHDIADPSTVGLMRSLHPEVVIHCAAQTSVAQSVHVPSADARTNILGGLNTILGAIECGARRFVYVTTGGALYGDTGGGASDEEQPIRPTSPYGLSKSVLEQYLAMLLPAPRTWAVLRLANVYGPRQRPDGEAGVVSVFCDRMLHSLPVEIHGDGLQTRDFVYVADVAHAVLAATDHRTSLTINVGSGTSISIQQLFESIAAMVGHAAVPVHVAPRPGDVRHSRLDSGLAKRSLRWSARTALHDGLAATLNWHRSIRSSPTTTET